MDAPKLTKSMQFALADLQLKHLWVVYPGKEKYRIAESVTVISLSDIDEIVQSFQYS